MALLEKDLTVKKSTIPNSGKGLFTKKLIPKGTRIIEYTGRVSRWKDVSDNHENGYIYYVTRNHVIDAGGDKKILARYANDATGLTKIKGITNNAKYVNEGTRVYLEAIKNITPGQEIFVSYGKEYWQVIRYNNRIEEKEKKAKA